MPDNVRNTGMQLLRSVAWIGAVLLAPCALAAEPDAQSAASPAPAGTAARAASGTQTKVSPYAKANRERLAAANAAPGPHTRSRKGPNHARRL